MFFLRKIQRLPYKRRFEKPVYNRWLTDKWRKLRGERRFAFYFASADAIHPFIKQGFMKQTLFLFYFFFSLPIEISSYFAIGEIKGVFPFRHVW